MTLYNKQPMHVARYRWHSKFKIKIGIEYQDILNNEMIYRYMYMYCYFSGLCD